MNKYKFLTLIALIFMGTLLTACDLLNKVKEGVKTNEVVQKLEDKKEELVKGNLTDLLKMNAALVCDTNVTEDESTMTAKTYISGKKMRIESTVTSKESTLTTYIINDAEWMYMWGQNPAQPNTGLKYKNMDMEKFAEDFKDLGSIVNPKPTTTDETTQETPQTPENNVQYSCKPWVVNESLFTPPTEVVFTDMSGASDLLTPKAQTPPTGNINASKCSICDMVTEPDAKAECKQKLGC